MDTGALQHFATDRNKNLLQNLKSTNNSYPAILPDSSKITSSHIGNLPLPKDITKQGSSILVYPKITNESLLSIGQLCDDNCSALFTKSDLLVFKNNKLILRGHRNFSDGL